MNHKYDYIISMIYERIREMEPRGGRSSRLLSIVQTVLRSSWKISAFLKFARENSSPQHS